MRRSTYGLLGLGLMVSAMAAGCGGESTDTVAPPPVAAAPAAPPPSAADATKNNTGSNAAQDSTLNPNLR